MIPFAPPFSIYIIFLCSIGIVKPKNIRIQKFFNQLDLLQREYHANANWQSINKKIKSQGFPATIMKNQARGATV